MWFFGITTGSCHSPRLRLSAQWSERQQIVVICFKICIRTSLPFIKVRFEKYCSKFFSHTVILSIASISIIFVYLLLIVASNELVTFVEIPLTGEVLFVDIQWSLWLNLRFCKPFIDFTCSCFALFNFESFHY